jgi:hypothetical protein
MSKGGRLNADTYFASSMRLHVDVLYDIGVPILLIWYWFTFFRDATRSSAASGTVHTMTSPLPRRPVPPETDRKLPKPTTFENF